MDVENIDGNNDDYNVRNVQENEGAERGGPSAIGMRIQKQLMQNWFPNCIDGDA